jgi:NAD(P) transhydrogenase subunit alpha
VAALVGQLVSDGELAIDLTDEIQQGVVVTHRGEIVHQAIAAALSDNAKAAT